MQSEQINELNTALAKAQGAMKNAPFDKTNPAYKNAAGKTAGYASLASITDTIRKALSENGLSYTQTSEIRDGRLVLVTKLRHTSGQWIASELPLPSVARIQELGSALTYARRYSLSAIVGVATDEDDDAEEAKANGQVVRTNGQHTRTPEPATSPIQPQTVEAPVDPDTGETTPHTIEFEDGIMAREAGRTLIAAMETSHNNAELEQWCNLNEIAFQKLKAAPKTLRIVHEARREIEKRLTAGGTA